MDFPLVSIIIPAYNAERYVLDTIHSVLNQTWPNREIIVVNDGSTDATLSILKQYEAEGVKIISQENKGQDAAANNGYRHAKGDYIKFMDSDDLLNPEMIDTQMKALNGADDYIAYGEWARFYNDKPELADFTKLDYWRDGAPLDFLTARDEGVMLQCGIMLIPRKLIEIAGLWDERLILFNDTEFFTRILLASKGVRFSAGARLYYRSGLINSISAGRSRKYYESTFLATSLMAGHLLQVEDSARTRQLISNTYQMQYSHMYPKFPDLCKQYEAQIRQHGGSNFESESGKVFKMIAKIAGWKVAKSIQHIIYEAGYYKLLHKLNRQKK